MDGFEKIIYELVGKVSILETKINVIEERIAELEGQTISEITENEQKQEGRDKSRYTLDGETYLKNRFVWAVVNKYIQEHPDVTFEDLSSVFDDKKQGSFGVVRKIDTVDLEAQPARYFCKKAQDILHLVDGDIVVCNQWGKGNILNIVKLAISLDYVVTKVQ